METLFGEEVRYLGWKQPFASLMLHGKIETRTWDTKYRGLVLITASKQSYSLELLYHIAGERQYNRIIDMLNIEMKFGYAIAVGRLVDSRLMTKEDSDRCFVEYCEPWIERRKGKPDRLLKLWCHVYEDVRAIEPVKIDGSQGWRKLSAEFIQTIKYL